MPSIFIIDKIQSIFFFDPQLTSHYSKIKYIVRIYKKKIYIKLKMYISFLVLFTAIYITNTSECPEKLDEYEDKQTCIFTFDKKMRGHNPNEMEQKIIEINSPDLTRKKECADLIRSGGWWCPADNLLSSWTKCYAAPKKDYPCTLLALSTTVNKQSVIGQKCTECEKCKECERCKICDKCESCEKYESGEVSLKCSGRLIIIIMLLLHIIYI